MRLPRIGFLACFICTCRCQTHSRSPRHDSLFWKHGIWVGIAHLECNNQSAAGEDHCCHDLFSTKLRYATQRGISICLKTGKGPPLRISKPRSTASQREIQKGSVHSRLHKALLLQPPSIHSFHCSHAALQKVQKRKQGNTHGSSIVCKARKHRDAERRKSIYRHPKPGSRKETFCTAEEREPL